ncbi:probable LRR receptor-like serine/threonine-protein kinase At1g56140 isoform X2 [Mangifera indica]|uniref:probable LRR receptor-like serine/threonine-protein kinase At1g56140 isoform X2 n=1 Tax=Mangifera indica TaxID=29780 RepID=UPI001CFAB3A3|nr:probable LRR receptor-like serine/threonine-protein kinase At1g56140 isoform X2 [Mangifera indica]
MLMKPSASTATSISVIGLCIFCCFFGLVHVGEAQNNQTQAATDPKDVSALNAIFEKWGISANGRQWNLSGDPCSGAAIDNSIAIDDPTYDPFIKCVCSFNNSSVCRITALKVYSLDVSGAIPDELWTLTSLTNLNLAQNFLTGPLSPSIANLTAMQYLTVGTNALSGELPKELGLLTELISFSIGINNFSGPLPSELGNWTKLEQLYIDSSGVSGEIPSSFANLQRLTTVSASDTELTGKIPDFIGTNWTKLNVLRLQGNSFTGPIPSSFSSLTSLTELRISDLSNGSLSSLAFIRDMKSLSTLDLSFNNLSGQIPSSLFNLSLLTHLFLGNNNLNGTLPAEKSTGLLNIDLSYNNLLGGFPSWINQENLQLNLVANNFTLESSNSSVLPHGLNCLQRTFPCYRDSPIYSSFAVKSGGPQITSSDNIVYERDNETLGPATYYVPDLNRWGVSNVGYFTGNNNQQYIIFSQSQFTNTLDSELFQTARISASSLRYYGLGLENGNYTVTLQFAEIANLDSSGWKSLGRRLFDIYVQGNLVEKDFNIKSLASGIPRRAVQREYKARVSENYLEIHFFWAGKGTCCVPLQGTYGPLISAISATPDFRPTVRAPTTEKNRTGMIVGIVVGVGVAFLLVLAVFFIVKRRKKLQNDDEELLGMDVKPYTFSYAELRNATDGFSPANKLGEGGFGPVYKGKLSDGRVIAVKQLSVASHQGKSQFAAEIATISAVQHRNLVKLYGCCYEGAQRILVYEYLENNSLDQALFGNSSLNLEWPTRYDICLGVARGLAYLHEESRLRIIHRDVKASNILLDVNLVPKISDFGLARLYDDTKTHISTRVAGTIGYLAPEYAMRGHLTEKTDVFAFGVVTLEIVSGRPNSDSSLDEEMMYLLEWAWFLHENNRELELVDSKLSQYSEEEVRRLIGVALLCTQTLPSLRPSMSRVVAMLCGDIEVSPVTSKPGYLTDWKFDDATIFVNENATKTNDSTSPDTCSTSLRDKASPGNGAKSFLQDIIGQGR